MVGGFTNNLFMQPGGEPLVLCFVDFMSPAHAATAMDALQGKLAILFQLLSTTATYLCWSFQIIACC